MKDNSEDIRSTEHDGEPGGIAGRIKEIRNALKLKGKDFAAQLNISGPSLSELENGKYNPNFDFIYNAARVFNVNLYYLLFGEGTMFIKSGKYGDITILEQLMEKDEFIRQFVRYFERSYIVRHFILSEFKAKLMSERKIIEDELEEFSRLNK
jgi:transcriptional regulator with XRE-family HTH domain